MSENLGESRDYEQWRSPRAGGSPVVLQGMGVVDRSFGAVCEPPLPEGYSYRDMETTGSRPWGLIQQIAQPNPDFDWRELLAILDKKFLIHEITIAIPELPETLLKLRALLKRTGNPYGLTPDNCCTLLGGRKRDSLNIITMNDHHLTTETVDLILKDAEKLFFQANNP